MPKKLVPTSIEPSADMLSTLASRGPIAVKTGGGAPSTEAPEAVGAAATRTADTAVRVRIGGTGLAHR